MKNADYKFTSNLFTSLKSTYVQFNALDLRRFWPETWVVVEGFTMNAAAALGLRNFHRSDRGTKKREKKYLINVSVRKLQSKVHSM